MKSRCFCLLLLLPVLIFILSGCSEYSDFSRGFYAGETITPDQIAAISAGLVASEKSAAESKQTAAPETVKKPVDTDAAGNIIVYWTAGGSVWHTDRNCGSIANSSAVVSGTINEAAAAGKTRACMKCSPDYENTSGNVATVTP